MSKMKAGIIGCGGRGHAHAQGYQASDDVDIIACADPIEDSGNNFAEHFSVPKVYQDYNEMLDQEDLDFVSVCTWIEMHTDMIVNAANSGIQAIHAEKPMAPTWGESKKQYQACVDNHVMITFCHQRRFGPEFVRARELAHDGTIGDLVRVEASCGNLLDWGTHWFDMFFFYNNDEPVDWVIGQIDGTSTHRVFGVPVENCGLSWIRWKNGLEGLLGTGGTGVTGAGNRLIGTHGRIEVHSSGVSLRVLARGASDWETVDPRGAVPEGYNDTTLSVLNLIECVKTGEEPELSGRKALQATELIFATYESSRCRKKITLPLEIEDSPLLSMIKNGDVAEPDS